MTKWDIARGNLYRQPRMQARPSRIPPSHATGALVPQEVVDEVAGIKATLRAEADEVERNTCQACGKPIKTMVFRGTDYCSGRCEKASVAQVPHNARRSFDAANCVCGWHQTNDDAAQLQAVVDTHNTLYAGQLVTVEAVPF